VRRAYLTKTASVRYSQRSFAALRKAEGRAEQPAGWEKLLAVPLCAKAQLPPLNPVSIFPPA